MATIPPDPFVAGRTMVRCECGIADTLRSTLRAMAAGGSKRRQLAGAQIMRRGLV
jgi:hypothetical protein